MMQEGELKRWDDARGFGFIRVGSNRPDVYIHISAFPPGMRPQVGDRILYDWVTQATGKGPRAGEAVVKGRSAVASSDSTQPRGRVAGKPRRRRDLGVQSLRWSPEVILVLSLAGFCLIGAATVLPHSPIPLLLYLVASTLAFILYGKDKYRAIQGTWRISEGTLHLVEAIGGWPGAFLAQRMMRHKTLKQSYQATFWLIVTGHVGIWCLWFLAPTAILTGV